MSDERRAEASLDRSALPRPVSDEIVRGRVVDALGVRWDVRLVVVEAAGGFGKSTAIAQAIRDNDADPSGIDVYARFRATDESIAVVASQLLDAFASIAPSPSSPLRDEAGAEGNRRHDTMTSSQAAAAVANAVSDRSPIDVCVCLDDVHLAEEVVDGVEFIEALIGCLPANGHLVLIGRSVRFVKRARLRAADELVEIGELELAFDDSEIATMAGRHGVDAAELGRAGGWPAVTRLAVTLGFDASKEFLFEELIDGLTDDHRRAIFVALTVGLATPRLLDACSIDVEATELLRTTPLLIEYDDGFGAHDLWKDVADHLVVPEQAAALAERVLDVLVEQDRLVEAIAVALRHRLLDAALGFIMQMFFDGDDRVSAEMVDRWVAGLGSGLAGRPEADFLAGFQRRLAGDVAGGATLLASAANGFEERGDIESETTAVKELAMSSWLLGDRDIWSDVVRRSQRLIAAGSERMRRSALGGRMVELDLRGDFDEMMKLYDEVDVFDEIALRHAASVAMLVGDGEKAIMLVDRLVEEYPKPLVFGHADATYWQVGRPRLDRLPKAKRLGGLGNARNDFLSLVFSSMMGACVGVVPELDRIDDLAWERSREQTFVALVHAAHGLLTADESTARSAFVRRLDEIGHDDPLLRGELRRFLPYAYVLSERDRAWIDEASLGPLHVDLRRLARTLLVARQNPGAPIGALPPWKSIIAWLPLPWSIEIAVRLAESGDERGVAFASILSDEVGSAIHSQLRRLRGEPTLTRGADLILAVVPGPPHDTTSLTVCGPFALEHGSSRVEVTRGRVRQLIQLLTLRPTWTRAALAEAMWPGLDDTRAGGNLRSTLRHVRRVLEPDREAGDAAFHLRQSDSRLWLHRSEWLRVDVWEIEAALDEAHQAEAAGQVEQAIRRRLDAFDRWQHGAFTDALDAADVAASIGDLQQRVTDAACWAAERRLSEGEHVGAFALADRVLAIDRLLERAHDVRLGALLASGDLAGSERAVHDLLAANRELGVFESSGSEMLIRRYERRSGRTVARTRGASAG